MALLRHLIPKEAEKQMLRISLPNADPLELHKTAFIEWMEMRTAELIAEAKELEMTPHEQSEYVDDIIEPIIRNWRKVAMMKKGIAS